MNLNLFKIRKIKLFKQILLKYKKLNKIFKKN